MDPSTMNSIENHCSSPHSPVIKITRPEQPDVTSFSWSDFPLLTEEFVYVDSYRKQGKAALRHMESSASKTELSPQRPFHVTKKSKTVGSIPSRKSTKKVRFDAVHIREHSITLGDHEWCEDSLPITLDWPHSAQSKSMFVSAYEQLRERQGRVPRGRLPKLEHWQRKQLLKRVGCMTEEELQQIEEESANQNGHCHYKGLSRTKTVPNPLLKTSNHLRHDEV